MSDRIIFKVEPRTITGKKVSQLRREGIVPANIYGIGGKSIEVQCLMGEFRRLYARAGETTVVYLQVGESAEQKPVLIDEIQMNPLNGDLVHLSFKQVDLKQKIEAEIPVEVVGEFKVPGGVLVTVLDSVLVEALPTDLPEKFEIDAATLTGIQQIITLKDLQFDKTKVNLVGVETDEDWDAPVVLVQEQREEEVSEDVAAGEVEITGESKAEATTDSSEAAK
jgi:large subunit ribosomal protein L25